MGPSKGKAVSITAIVEAALAAKAAPREEEPYQSGTTYNQYVLRGKPKAEGDLFPHAIGTPTRDWPDLSAEEDAVICFKNATSAIMAVAQEQVAKQVPGAYFAWLGSVPVEEQVANGTKGFGAHDRIFEVALTPEIVDMIAAVASFNGEEHVTVFQAKAEAEAITRKVYRKAEGEAKARLEALRHAG